MTLDPNDYCAKVKARAGKLYPDFINSPALKTVTREQAREAGWPVYYEPAACAFGHVASKYVANDQCTDCWLIKQHREPIYPRAKNQTFRKAPAPKTADASGAPVVIAPPAPPEPTKREQELLAAIDLTRDFDAAAASIGWTRGQIEARASSNEVFRKALDDLCARRDIPRTRAPNASTFKWTYDIEQQLARRYVDTGLIEAARTELGIPASDYQQHLEESREFAELIEKAHPRARVTLRERAEAAADRGNDRLLRILQDEALEDEHWMVLNGRRVPRYFDPDKALAELTAMMAEVEKRLDQQDALGKGKQDESAVIEESNEDVDDSTVTSKDPT